MEQISKREIKKITKCSKRDCWAKPHVKGLCKKHYDREYQKKWTTKRNNNHWADLNISESEKNLLRLVLLRFKWGYESEIDYYLLCDFYLRFKSDKMPEFNQYGDEKYISQIRKILKKIFKEAQ